MGLSWTELLVVFGVLLLFFGAKRIPEVARALGKASREFKNARDGVVNEVRRTIDDEEETADGGKSERRESASDVEKLK